jgi:hypothetical protein
MKKRHLSQCRVALVVAGVIVGACVSPPSHAQETADPATFSEFLQQYVGKEVLLVDKASDMGQTDAPDSLDRYVALLESVTEQGILVRRSLESDKRSLAYAFTDIRRVTYLFNGRRYRRIVIEIR